MDQPPVAEKGGTFSAARAIRLRGRQDRQAIAQSAEHLSALKRQAGAIELLFADEAEASTHPYLARLWARRGANLRVEAPGKAHKRALFGARRHASGELIVQTAIEQGQRELLQLSRAPQASGQGQARAPRPR